MTIEDLKCKDRKRRRRGIAKYYLTSICDELIKLGASKAVKLNTEYIDYNCVNYCISKLRERNPVYGAIALSRVDDDVYLYITNPDKLKVQQ